MNIEVRRNRGSVTQQEAVIFVNGEEVMSFYDAMWLYSPEGMSDGFKTIPCCQQYGMVAGGWGSIAPDSKFIDAFMSHIGEPAVHDKFMAAVKKTDDLNRYIRLTIDGYPCFQQDAWEKDGSSYILGVCEDMSEGMFYYAKVTTGNSVATFEYDGACPQRQKVQDDYADRLAEAEIDRHEAAVMRW